MMNQPGRLLQWIVWGGLLSIVVAIAAAFAVSRLAGEPLPVWGDVPDFNLVDQDGNAVTLSDMEGQVWIANVIFTRCPLICADLTRAMREVQYDLPANRPVRLVSLTADPGYDTPEVLKKYARRFGAREHQWMFLTGDRQDVHGLVIDGLKLPVVEKDPSEWEMPDDLFIHSARFVLVDQQGRIRAWFDGDVPESRKEILAAVRKLLREGAP
jgi:protein SCO1